MSIMALRLLLLVSLLIAADGEHIVRKLPGYNGDLPFTLETGYVGVGQNEDVQLFYHFVESQKEPSQDPLMLWIAGGPGCSGLAGFFFESGPLSFSVRDYNGDLPSLYLNPYTWSKGLNIIYLDAPVGTGFSYSKTFQGGYHIGDYKFVAHTYEFLLKWLIEHPQYLANHLYIAGEGYSGKPIPIIAQEILKGNEDGTVAALNLKGYVIGNPGTDTQIDFNSRIPLAHRLTLISDELFESAKKHCNGDFLAVNQSKQCASDIDAIKVLLSQINTVQVFEPSCLKMQPKLSDLNSTRKYLQQRSRGFYRSQPDGPELWCREYDHIFSFIWANDKYVQEALHVRKGTKSCWQYCNDTLNDLYIHDVSSVVDYHRKLSKANLRVLLYSGDVDMAIPHIATQKWIMSLNLTMDETWRAWSVNGQTAGYTMKFINKDFSLTYATVKGAGHFAAEHKMKECSTMIDRWMSYHPL